MGAISSKAAATHETRCRAYSAKSFPVLATSSANNVRDFGEASHSLDDLPVLVEQVDSIEKERDQLPNPGLYENALNELKGPVSVDAFDGFRFDFTRILGQNFSTSHSILLGSSMIPGGLYQFGANVVAEDPMDPSTFLMSKITPDGFLDARWNQRLSSNWKLRVKGQLKPSSSDPSADGGGGESQVLADLDYMCGDFCCNFKVSNGPLYGMSYFQSLTQRLALGGEAYFHGEHVKVIAAYCARYTADDWVAAGTAGAGGTLQLQYLRKIQGHRMKYGSELTYNYRSGESNATMGGQFEIGASRLSMSLDQSGRVASSVETHVLPNFLLTLAAEAFPAKSDFKFGYGAQITF
uniref:Mitochondrial Protein Translocase (MPT) Family puta n=1 Tax=Albugo laibachii Nc14 TaxID=890382 RepID=F0WEB2_9STRA|nr:Mitochondrial Protein Translocase (MPT) Family puta [Albugo laibachii Nc14]|eukprot:CCA19543.1 Mitochondrial Protein Translocase (MPT) Family puta [Albugo laibachii Nc14]